MENKGQGIFYGVIGVATLIVAIIGATFAYFSAQTTAGSGTINGTTLDVSTSSLKLTVDRVAFVGATNNPNLVPANITPTLLSGAGSVGQAVTNKCEDGNYTGCHLYRITIGASDDVAVANVTLAINASNATVESDWHYVLFTGSETEGTGEGNTGKYTVTASALVNDNAFPQTTATVHNTGLTKNVDQVYYLLVYLTNDTENAQNAGDAQDATGTYSGEVTMKVGTGTIAASFNA